MWSFAKNAGNVPSGTTAPAGNWNKFVTMTRPPEATLLKQLDLVNGYADLRADRAREIVAQMSPQYAFWGSVVPLYPARHPYTLELVGMVLRLAKYAEMNFKHALCVRRPNEYSPQVQPMIQTPIHGSLPSGHSTEAHAVARVLGKLVEVAVPPAPAVLQLRQLLMRQAVRIAINRTIAGVHFPVDSLVGQLLGLAVGDYFIARATGAPAVYSWTFDGESYPDGSAPKPGDGDFTGTEIYDVQNDAFRFQPPNYLQRSAAAIPVDMAPMLNWLWLEARKEWP